MCRSMPRRKVQPLSACEIPHKAFPRNVVSVAAPVRASRGIVTREHIARVGKCMAGNVGARPVEVVDGTELMASRALQDKVRSAAQLDLRPADERVLVVTTCHTPRPCALQLRWLAYGSCAARCGQRYCLRPAGG